MHSKLENMKNYNLENYVFNSTMPKPWRGDLLSFAYDFLMKHIVFPRKFGANYDRHKKIMRALLEDIHNTRILELAAGSGHTAEVLNCDNQYIGTDISPGLLKIARRKFKRNHFNKAEFQIMDAENIHFQKKMFDYCFCFLSLNFFENISTVFDGIARVLKPGGVFICAISVPERSVVDSDLRGIFYSESELELLLANSGFSFYPTKVNNGSLLYFQAVSS